MGYSPYDLYDLGEFHQKGSVRTELARWGAWYLNTTGVDGFRLDAVKHIQYRRLE